MNTIDAGLLKELFIAGFEALEAKKEYVNELNVFPVPDGDTGTNMTMTIQSAVKEVKALKDDSMESLCKAISSGSLRGARGNSGVILSQLLRGFTKTIKEYDEIDTDIMAEAFEKAVNTAYKAVMKPKEGTILTVAKAGSDMATYLTGSDIDIVTYMEAVIEHMRNVLNQTPDMLPVLKEAGVVDSGGEGLLVILEGAFVLLAGRIPKPEGAKKPDISNIKKKKSVAKKPEPAKKPEVKSKKQEKKVYSPVKSKADISTADIQFGYCTEFIIVLEKEFDDFKERELKVFLEAIGDSIVVVADDDIVKVHVHTNMPGIALQKALTYGSLSKIKIDNMREEHNELLMNELSETVAAEDDGEEAVEEADMPEETIAEADAQEEAIPEVDVPEEIIAETDVQEEDIAEDVPEETDTPEEDIAENVSEETDAPEEDITEEDVPEETDASEEDIAEEDVPEETTEEADMPEESGKPLKPAGFITVSAGEGLSKIFAGLGADIIIEGGQTMNPSTEDMLNAIERIDAETIFILPNNSNIILAAQQTKLMCEDKQIIVIPSKTIPQGIMAMLNYMPTRSISDNEKAMISEMDNVKSGAVTYSIRDTVVQGHEIKQGDIMGIENGTIINTGVQVMATTVELIKNLIDEDTELITLYYGKDTTEDEANLIASNILKDYPDIEVEVHYGGQPVYYYYLSVE